MKSRRVSVFGVRSGDNRQTRSFLALFAVLAMLVFGPVVASAQTITSTTPTATANWKAPRTVYIPQTGYVGVGTVVGPPVRFDEARVVVDGVSQPLATQPLAGSYTHHGAETDDDTEWVVPVRWMATVAVSDAYREKGLFANQNSACKLRQEFTLDRLAQHFKIDHVE